MKNPCISLWTDRSETGVENRPTPINVDINNLSIDYHRCCSSSYLDYFIAVVASIALAMEIKLELDTDKTTKAAVAIATAFALSRVSERSSNPQLAAANALALIVVIAILYGPRPAPKRAT